MSTQKYDYLVLSLFLLELVVQFTCTLLERRTVLCCLKGLGYQEKEKN